MDRDFDEEFEDEEEFEYDPEVLSHLETLTKLTIDIFNIYQKLISLEIHKEDVKSFELIKELLIYNLNYIKRLEEFEYDYFSEDYGRAVCALDFLDENYEGSKDMLKHNELLCYTRIYERLSKIEIIDGISQEYAENKHEVTSTPKYRILQRSGYNEEEAVFFCLDYSATLSASISLRYASMLEDEIATRDNNADLIKMRYEEAFASPDNLEDALIRVRFGHIKRNLREELIPPYDIDKKVLQEFIMSDINSCLLDLVNKINNHKGQAEKDSCFALFKTYLLYIQDDDLPRVIALIESLIIDYDIKEALVQIAYQYKDLQKAQNVECQQKTI